MSTEDHTPAIPQGSGTRYSYDRRYLESVALGEHGGGQTYVLKPAGYSLLQRLAKEGHGTGSMAKALNISPTTLRGLLRRDPDAATAVGWGLSTLEHELTHGLLEQFRAGNVTAGIFLAKARLGWREGEAPDHVDRPTPPVQINISIPEKMDPDEVMKIIGPVPPAEGDDE